MGRSIDHAIDATIAGRKVSVHYTGGQGYYCADVPIACINIAIIEIGIVMVTVLYIYAILYSRGVRRESRHIGTL